MPTETSHETLEFEPTDLFDFDFDPRAQSIARQETFGPDSLLARTDDLVPSDVFSTESNPGDSGEHGTREAVEYSRPEPVGRLTPPPNMDPDESMFFDDEMALMEMEREAGSLGPGPEGMERGSGAQKEVETVDRSGDDDLLSTGIFDFDAPVASSSRVNLTPPPVYVPLPITSTIDKERYTQSGLIEPEIPCTLPALTAATSGGGYVTFKRRWKPQAVPAQTLQQRGSKGVVGELLTVPLHKLLAQVEELKSREQAVKLQNQFDAERVGGRNGKKVDRGSAMWVDKYRPQKFADLLGEDRVHRDVMNWLKEWDKCVFKRAPPQAKKRRYDDTDAASEYTDALGRPRERVLLLSGPPGYGKTTLASIVAQHAGYNILEVNASDDRSYQTVQTRIKNAVDSGSGLGSNGVPTCVIVDEIDGTGGAENGFIKALIKLIQDVPARKKTNTPAKPLRRPIICICNDLYSPALRPLRPYARIIRFHRPQAQALVVRLRDICNREDLKSDTRTLNALVEMTSGDVRSCLNTLQFIKNRSDVVTEESIKSSSLGLKDTNSTLQSAWNALFVPLPAKKRRAQGIDDTRILARVVPIVQSCGDYDKLLLGAFEHYPRLKPLDSTLGNLSRVHDWMGFTDRLQGRIGSEQAWELMGYVPWSVGAWYSHLAAPANSSRLTEYPKADYECYQTRTSNEQVATAFKASLPPILRSMFSTTTTLTELVPFLMRIISPPLKPVNANIVKPGEKALLERLVELLIPLGLNFFKEKAENGQPMMRLEPAIDVFVHYEGKRAEDILVSRFTVRQLVSQAMDAEVARRRGGDAGAKGGAAGTGTDGFVRAYGLKGGGNGKPVDKSLLPVTDFFGRTVTIIEKDIEEGSAPRAPPAKKFRAVYKFNEGSLSAVRRSIKMSALL